MPTQPASVAEPTIDQAAKDSLGVDAVPIQQGSTVEWRPSHDQLVVGAASFGGIDGDFPGNMQPAADANGDAITHDATQVMNMLIGEWCKRFGETPQAAIVHMCALLQGLRTQVYS